MSSDVSMFDDELKSLEDEVVACLRALDQLSGEARLSKYDRAQELLKKIGKTMHQFKYEVRMLEGAEQAVYEKKAQQHQSTINSLKEQTAQKRNATAAAAAPPPKVGGPSDPRREEARQMTDRIGKTQNSTLQSLERTERLVAESEEVGQDAAQTLKKQTEQIKVVNQELDQLDSQVNRAKKELNAFIRRMATDKIIICFVLLIVIGIIVIIILRAKNGSGASPVAPPIATTPPPTTVLTTTTTTTTTSTDLPTTTTFMPKRKQSYLWPWK